jgi:hypothetical protein
MLKYAVHMFDYFALIGSESDKEQIQPLNIQLAAG